MTDDAPLGPGDIAMLVGVPTLYNGEPIEPLADSVIRVCARCQGRVYIGPHAQRDLHSGAECIIICLWCAEQEAPTELGDTAQRFRETVDRIAKGH